MDVAHVHPAGGSVGYFCAFFLPLYYYTVKSDICRLRRHGLYPMTCGTLCAHRRALSLPFSPFRAASRKHEVQKVCDCVISTITESVLCPTPPSFLRSCGEVTTQECGRRPYIGFHVTGAGPHQPHLYAFSPDGPPSTRPSSTYPSRLSRRVLRPTSRGVPSPVPAICTSMPSFQPVG